MRNTRFFPTPMGIQIYGSNDPKGSSFPFYSRFCFKGSSSLFWQKKPQNSARYPPLPLFFGREKRGTPSPSFISGDTPRTIFSSVITNYSEMLMSPFTSAPGAPSSGITQLKEPPISLFGETENGGGEGLRGAGRWFLCQGYHSAMSLEKLRIAFGLYRAMRIGKKSQVGLSNSQW